MNIDVTFIPAEVTPDIVKDKSVVIIDVLRACTTIITAFDNGAAAVLPVSGVTNAKKIERLNFTNPVLLCGERGGIKIPGFNLGNSPQEYTRENVEGRTLVFTSTNGAKLFELTHGAGAVCLGALHNASSVAKYLSETTRDLVLLCAGNEGRFSQDDVYCAGCIIQYIAAISQKTIKTSDGARLARHLFEKYRTEPLTVLYTAAHGRYLANLGYESDLAFCAMMDISRTIPIYKDGKVYATLP